MNALRSLLTGAVSGAMATVPMTAVMEALHRRLPNRERYPLPPREITQSLTRKAGVEQELTEPEHQRLALAGHFAYGASTGAIFQIIDDWLADRADLTPGADLARSAGTGIAYGLAVWTASYLAWLPAANILKPATQHPARRNALMIAAHVVWGAAMGTMASALRKRGV